MIMKINKTNDINIDKNYSNSNNSNGNNNDHDINLQFFHYSLLIKILEHEIDES